MQPWPSFHISPNKVGVQKSSEDNIEKISSLCSQENALSAVIFPVFPSPPGPVDLGDCLVHYLLVFIRPPSSSTVAFACSFRVIPLHKNHICLFFFRFCMLRVMQSRASMSHRRLPWLYASARCLECSIHEGNCLRHQYSMQISVSVCLPFPS